MEGLYCSTWSGWPVCFYSPWSYLSLSSSLSTYKNKNTLSEARTEIKQKAKKYTRQKTKKLYYEVDFDSQNTSEESVSNDEEASNVEGNMAGPYNCANLAHSEYKAYTLKLKRNS